MCVCSQKRAHLRCRTDKLCEICHNDVTDERGSAYTFTTDQVAVEAARLVAARHDRSQIARRTPPPSTSSICSVRQPWWAPSPHQAATNSPRRNGRESASTRWDWPSPSSPSAQRRLRTMWAVSCPAPPSTRGATRRRFLLPPFFTFSPFLLFSPMRQPPHATRDHTSRPVSWRAVLPLRGFAWPIACSL